MPVSFLPFAFPGLPRVRCAFQTRTGGVSQGPYAGGNISYAVGDEARAVRANRQSLLDALRPFGLRAWAEARQVHGDGLLFDPPPAPCEAFPLPEADGLATAAPGLGLCIKTADCQPILLAHKDGAYIMALHAGWRGNRCDFPRSAVGRFCERYRLRPQDLLAVRGPSLGPGRAEFVRFDTEWGPDWKAWLDERSRTMDLWSLTRHQLAQAGLLPRHIHGLDWCTAENADLFYSYRRARVTGRQANLIWMVP